MAVIGHVADYGCGNAMKGRSWDKRLACASSSRASTFWQSDRPSGQLCIIILVSSYLADVPDRQYSDGLPESSPHRHP